MYDKTPGKKTTAERLKEAMQEQGLRQADIIKRAEPYFERVGAVLKRNDVSQYCSGVNLPRQDKLTLMSLALGVSEAWLMGYSVPKQLSGYTAELYENVNHESAADPSAEETEKETAYAIMHFLKLDSDDKKLISKHINKLLRAEKYK